MRAEQQRREGRAAGLEAATGRSTTLVVAPVGAGRTTFLGEVADREQAAGRRVLWCRGRHVGPADGDGAVLLASPTDEVGAAVAAAPTTLLVDDAHRLDDAVLHAVTWLAERAADLGARVVVSHPGIVPPDAPNGPDLARLDQILVGHHGAVHLGPLPGLGRPDDPFDDDPDAAEILRGTGGWADLVAARLQDTDAVDDLVISRFQQLDPTGRDVLAALSFGLPVGTDALAVATGADPDVVDGAVAAARAVGLLHDADAPVPVVADAVRAATPTATRARIAAAVAEVGTPELVVTVALSLHQLGERSPAAGTVYLRAAHQVHRTDPPTALALCDATLATGRAGEEVATVRAAAALAAGQFDEVVTIVAGAHVGDTSDGRRRGRLAAAGWMHLARPSIAAAHYPTAHPEPLAVGPLLAAGQLDAARASTADAEHRPTDAAAVLADALLAWVDGDRRSHDAFARSEQLVERVDPVDEWPDTPHALHAVARVQRLAAADAERSLRTALERAVGGAAYEARHQLLLAWAVLRGGRVDEAELILAGRAPAAGRDAMVAAAVRAAIALRTADPAELPAHCRDVLAGWSSGEADLAVVDLAGEVAHLAARVGHDPESILAPLDALAAQLGHPPAFTSALAWARLGVAGARDDAAAARAAADDLARVAADDLLSTTAAAMADVLAGRVDPDATRTAASGLVEHGLVDEAARLLGAAAVRTTDAAAARTLLADLRRLRGARHRRGGRRHGIVAELSPREREVARAVLDGHTHREIGELLYISAKTVEHHVASIRQKLAVSTRAELLAAIREELDEGALQGADDGAGALDDGA